MNEIMTQTAQSNTPFFVTLKNRGLIHVEGGDRVEFLQGLVSNDVSGMNAGDVRYACLLTPQGKFLHDFFIHVGDGFFILDCEGGVRAQDLYKRLRMYCLRKDVQLSIEENAPIYAVFNADIGTPDPRHDHMERRSFEKPTGILEKNMEAWDTHRISLCIPDGSRDMIVGKSTLLECGIDTLNGISFEKGCYVGQELTARMHYRGLVKKRLGFILHDGDGFPEFGEKIIQNDKTIGEMRSSCGDVGLALFRI